MNKFTTTLLALAATAFAAQAQAQTYQMDVFAYGGDNSFTTAATNASAKAAPYDWERVNFFFPAGIPTNQATNNTGGLTTAPASTSSALHANILLDYTSQSSFIAFCIEPLVGLSTAALNNNVNLRQTYVRSTEAINSNVQKLFDIWGGTVLQQIDPVTATTPALKKSGAVYAEAMQLAIWELVTGTTDFSVTTGGFRLNGVNVLSTPAETTEIENLANRMLTDVANNAPANPLRTASFILRAPSGESSQGLVTIALVPEPTTYAMIVAGLGIVGLSLRRRQAA